MGAQSLQGDLPRGCGGSVQGQGEGTGGLPQPHTPFPTEPKAGVWDLHCAAGNVGTGYKRNNPWIRLFIM